MLDGLVSGEGDRGCSCTEEGATLQWLDDEGDWIELSNADLEEARRTCGHGGCGSAQASRRDSLIRCLSGSVASRLLWINLCVRWRKSKAQHVALDLTLVATCPCVQIRMRMKC